MTGNMMLYAGIGIAALGLVLLMTQLAVMKKQKNLSKEAVAFSDAAPVAVAKPDPKKDERIKASQPENEYERTVKLVQDESLKPDDESTVKPNERSAQDDAVQEDGDRTVRLEV